MALEVDLALFFIIVGIILFFFLEVSVVLGSVALIVGTGIFLGWVQYRTKIFS